METRTRAHARRASALAATVAALGLFASACSNDASDQSDTTNAATESSVDSAAADKCALLQDFNWLNDNRERINDMIKDLGECGADPEREGAPLALFDWDNTVVKNDTAEALINYMLLNDKVKQPPSADWANLNEYFTPEIITELNDKCGGLAPEGEVLPTSKPEGAECADIIEKIIEDSETSDGTPAFQNFNARRIEPAYAFKVQLLAGYTEDEITDFARETRDEYISAPEGTKVKVGSKEYNGWIRYYDEITDLINVLKEHGFDVRIVTASPQPQAQAWGEKIGLEPDKVMGVKTVLDGDKWSYEMVQCGGEKSMTYIEGKRCRVNEEVLGITGPEAWDPAPEDKRQVFAAGDSNTDVSFVGDATYLRLAVNRNKQELMCNAYFDEDDKWLVNPMFIEPKDKQDEPYDCDENGRIEEDDSTGPLHDSQGNPIPDQEDAVYELQK